MIIEDLRKDILGGEKGGEEGGGRGKERIL